MSILDILRKHKVIIAIIFAYLCMMSFQWLVHYKYFPWNSLLIYLIFGLYLYGFAYLIEKFLPQNAKLKLHFFYGNKEINKTINLVYLAKYILICVSYVMLIYYLAMHSGLDMPLTPYPVIDDYLVKIDNLFYFNEADIYLFFQVHAKFVYYVFDGIYNQLNFIIALTLICLPFLNRKSFEKISFLFFVLMGMTFIFCYFFPSINPAYYYHDVKFPHLVEQEVRQYLAFKSGESFKAVTGSISCPSWHTLGALLMIIGWWPVKRFKINYIVLTFNLLIIISIFIVGWHYLADAIMSCIFLGVALYLYKITERKSLQKEKVIEKFEIINSSQTA